MRQAFEGENEKMGNGHSNAPAKQIPPKGLNRKAKLKTFEELK
jgi:hypothetical protein